MEDEMRKAQDLIKQRKEEAIKQQLGSKRLAHTNLRGRWGVLQCSACSLVSLFACLYTCVCIRQQLIDLKASKEGRVYCQDKKHTRYFLNNTIHYNRKNRHLPHIDTILALDFIPDLKCYVHCNCCKQRELFCHTCQAFFCVGFPPCTFYAPRKISGEHIVVASSVRPSVSQSVRPSVRPSVRTSHSCPAHNFVI